ncbi:lysosomal acid glucosylceramidase-like [Calliopsis andreniformis]|uniref:lysosomal acid glucosylceramidase-like n=1 Tax=Calliopsis andreniformis TaxID=337506 RepID=UPI003FCECEA4
MEQLVNLNIFLSRLIESSKMWTTVLIISLSLIVTGNARDCAPYKIDNVVLACVCNATYCDSTPPYNKEALDQGISYWYVTNKQGLRMKMSQLKFQDENSCENSLPNTVLTIDSTKRYQKILGFGGAITDSVGMLLEKLSLKTQDQLLRSYYDPISGSRYSLTRIPIGASDFSPKSYTYDDVENDVKLKHFSLAEEDYKYKIPNLKKALEINPELKFFAAAWSAPGWMKTNGQFVGFGYLKRQYYQVYANYIVKFLDEYKKNGINIWAVSTGNEPKITFQVDSTTASSIITMGWTPRTMAKWVGRYLGPTLHASGNNDTQVLALDDFIFDLPSFVTPILSDKRSRKYTTGTAVHWYFDNKSSINVMDETHEKFPEKILLMTEASISPPVWQSQDIISTAWNHGERYIISLIKYLNHWSVGWVDWNLVLDKEGGPTNGPIKLDAAIIANTDEDEFYKLPMYYAIKHLSKFVDRDSIRISITDTDTIKTAGFITPSKEIVLILYNSADSSQRVTLKDIQKNDRLCFELSPYSMNTIIYKY